MFKEDRWFLKFEISKPGNRKRSPLRLVWTRDWPDCKFRCYVGHQLGGFSKIPVLLVIIVA